VHWDNNQSGERVVRIYVDKTYVVAGQAVPANLGGDNQRQNVSAVIRLDRGETIQASVWQTSAADRLLTPTDQENSLSAAFIGP